MIARVYLRVAKYSGRNADFKVDARATPNHAPLESGTGVPLPTVAFAVDMDIPEKAFKRAEQVIATIAIPEEALEIAAEVIQ